MHDLVIWSSTCEFISRWDMDEDEEDDEWDEGDEGDEDEEDEND